MSAALSYAVWAVLGLATLSLWARSHAAGLHPRPSGVVLGAPGVRTHPPGRPGPCLDVGGAGHLFAERGLAREPPTRPELAPVRLDTPLTRDDVPHVPDAA